MKKGDKVVINGEAVEDSELNSNKGTIIKWWDEPLANSEPTPLVKILLDNGDKAVVGQHEIEILK